jgi:hypothetical protein
MCIDLLKHTLLPKQATDQLNLWNSNYDLRGRLVGAVYLLIGPWITVGSLAMATFCTAAEYDNSKGLPLDAKCLYAVSGVSLLMEACYFLYLRSAVFKSFGKTNLTLSTLNGDAYPIELPTLISRKAFINTLIKTLPYSREEIDIDGALTTFNDEDIADGFINLTPYENNNIAILLKMKECDVNTTLLGGTPGL